MRHRPSCRSRAMHVPRELYPIERALAEHLPHLRGPQRRGLALRVLGAVLAQSACQAAVLAALLPWAPYHALRQRLREWLVDGADKAVPCAAQVDVERCFAPLLRWVLGWWQGRELALAVDATAHREDVVALVVSVLYRGSAIPVAWAVLPGNVPGPWLGTILRLLRRLRPAAQAEPWVVVAGLPADRVGVSWYALRAWVELGFRALKSLGWQWQRSRRTDPARVARHWLVLAVASLTALAHGTRVEDARERGLPPARLRAPPASRAGTRPRRISLVRLGIQWLRHLLARGRLWRRLWLAPEPWPQPPPGLAITVHGQGA